MEIWVPNRWIYLGVRRNLPSIIQGVIYRCPNLEKFNKSKVDFFKWNTLYFKHLVHAGRNWLSFDYGVVYTYLNFFSRYSTVYLVMCVNSLKLPVLELFSSKVARVKRIFNCQKSLLQTFSGLSEINRRPQ